MLQQFMKAWNQNRGNLLISLGAVAGLLMCLMWYFQLVPEVRLISRNVSGTLVSKSQRVDQSPLVITLRMPSLDPSLGATPTVELRAVVELHLPGESLQPASVPLTSRALMLRNDGTAAAVVFSDTQPGRYAVLAYLDLNNNERFDMDDAHQPLEPYRLSKDPDYPNQIPKEKAEPFNLDAAAIEVAPGQTTLVEFDFRQTSR